MRVFSLFFLIIMSVQITYIVAESQDVLWQFKSNEIINSFSVSEDGNYVVIGTENHNVLLLSNNGKLIWSYTTDGEVEAVSISKNNTYVVAATSGYTDDKNVRRVSGTIYLFSISGKLLWKYNTGSTIDSEVYSISITREGEYIAAGTGGGTLYFISSKGDLLWYYKMGNKISSITFSADGSSMLVVLDNDEVLIVSNNRDILGRFEAMGSINSISSSLDGSYIAIGTKIKNNGQTKGTIYLLSKSTEFLWKYDTDQECSSVNISQSGSFISATAGNNVFLFSKSGRLLWKNELTKNSLYSYIFNNESLLVVSQENRIYLFSNKGKILWSKQLENKIDKLYITSKGNIICLNEENNEIYEFKPKLPLLFTDLLFALVQILLLSLFLVIGAIFFYIIFIKYQKWDEKLLKTNISIKISFIFFCFSLLIIILSRLFSLGILTLLVLILSVTYAFSFLTIYFSRERIFKKYYSWEAYKEQKINPVLDSAKQKALVFFSSKRVPQNRKK